MGMLGVATQFRQGAQDTSLFPPNRQCLPVKQSKALVLEQLASLMHLNSAGKELVLLPLHLEGTYFMPL